MSAGRALLFLICSAGVVLRNHPSSNRNSKALAALACNRHHNAHISFLGVLSEAGQAIKQKDPCDSLPPGTKCFHDMKVWQPSLASVSQCLLKRPIVYVNENTRLQCDQMRRVDPSVVQVDQSHCYPDEYFTAIPSAAYLLERYPINLRPKSTDLDVLQQVRNYPLHVMTLLLRTTTLLLRIRDTRTVFMTSSCQPVRPRAIY